MRKFVLLSILFSFMASGLYSQCESCSAPDGVTIQHCYQDVDQPGKCAMFMDDKPTFYFEDKNRKKRSIKTSAHTHSLTMTAFYPQSVNVTCNLFDPSESSTTHEKWPLCTTLALGCVVPKREGLVVGLITLGLGRELRGSTDTYLLRDCDKTTHCTGCFALEGS